MTRVYFHDRDPIDAIVFEKVMEMTIPEADEIEVVIDDFVNQLPFSELPQFIQDFDILVIPLTLEEARSMVLAEIIHRTQPDTIVILVSNTRTEPPIIEKVFDYFFPTTGIIDAVKVIERIIAEDLLGSFERIQEASRLKKHMDEIVSNAYCLKHLPEWHLKANVQIEENNPRFTGN